MRGKIRNKTNVILALVAVMVMGIAGSTCTEVNAGVIQPRGNCMYCDWPVGTSCLRQNVYAYTASCNKSSSCKVKVYESRSAQVCSGCGRYIEYYGYHECAESHSSCGKGYVSICTVHYMPPSNLKENIENVSEYNKNISILNRLS